MRTALAGRPLDVLFIDGDHSYDGVASDFAAYGPLVRQGGLIGFHDIVAQPDTGVERGDLAVTSRSFGRTFAAITHTRRSWPTIREASGSAY